MAGLSLVFIAVLNLHLEDINFKWAHGRTEAAQPRLTSVYILSSQGSQCVRLSDTWSRRGPTGGTLWTPDGWIFILCLEKNPETGPSLSLVFLWSPEEVQSHIRKYSPGGWAADIWGSAGRGRCPCRSRGAGVGGDCFPWHLEPRDFCSFFLLPPSSSSSSYFSSFVRGESKLVFRAARIALTQSRCC